MSSEPEDGVGDRAPYEYTPEQLRQMDDAEARETLTVDQYERREKIIDLHDGADAQQAEWADTDERVTDLVVNADVEQLGTRVDLYGNDALVHLDTEDSALIDAIESLDDDYGDIDTEDIELLADADKRALASHVMDAYDAILVEWNGHAWDELREDERDGVLAKCREKWGLDAMFIGLMDAFIAVASDREERVEAAKSFRGAQR